MIRRSKFRCFSTLRSCTSTSDIGASRGWVHIVLSKRCAAGVSSTTSTATHNDGTSKASSVGLSLGLDFSKMNFDAMAKTTKAALKSEEEFRKDVMLGGVVSELDSLTQSIAPKRAPAQQQHGWAATGQSSTPRPTSWSESLGSGKRATSSGPPKQTLKETLQDCVVSGNWSKAVQLFSQAVVESKKAAQVHHQRHGAGSPNQPPTVERAEDDGGHPPTVQQDLLASAYEHEHVGLARWNGNHIQTVIRCIVAAEVPAVVRDVWHVIQAANTMKHRFDAHNLNGIIGTATRRGQDAVGGLTHQSARPAKEKEEWSAFLDEWKALKRQIVLDVGNFAAASNIALNDASNRSYLRARENEKTRELLVQRQLQKDRTTTTTAGGDASLPFNNVQEFNRLLEHLVKQEERDLRRSKERAVDDAVESREVGWTVESLLAASRGEGVENQSREGHNSTAAAPSSPIHPLAPVRWNERTYSILLHRLHKRQQHLINQQTPATDSPQPLASASKAELWEQSPLLSEAETLFAAYLTNHVGSGRHPAPFVLADMLEFVKHRRTMDRRVYELVALLMQPESRSEFVDRFSPRTAGGENNGQSGEERGGPSPPEQHPLPWSKTHPPSPKIFEILIRHALHMHRTAECQYWFDEMNKLGVHGTGVVYHTMIELASTSKRPKPSPGSGGATTRDPHQEILNIYGQMKNVGYDVSSVSTTVSLINAWSSKHQARRRLR